MTAVISTPVILPAGEVVATGVSFEDYMAHYAETFHEWVRAVVVKMSPVSEQLLPRLALHVPTLWADPLPGVLATAQAVQAMLKAE